MSNRAAVSKSRVAPAGAAAPAWWVVFSRELTDLWIGGKALNLILIYSVILGIQTYVYATNSELSLIPPKEAVYETLKTAIAVSLFMGLVIGSDSFSGERERGTIEGLLLTPASRRQIVTGKFLAGISAWPVAMLITIPYMSVLSQGDEVLGPAILWGAILGSVLVPAYVGLGMLVSFWSSTNRTSFFISLGLYVLFLIPAQLPGRAQTGVAGQFLQWVNPMAAVSHFLSKHLVNYRPVAEFWPWLISPLVFAALVLGTLFLYAGPGLRLEPGRQSRLWALLSRATGLILAALLIFALHTPGALAAEQAQDTSLQITVDMDYTTVKTGDKVEFNTLVTNNGTADSPPLIVAMNVINLNAQGDVVDPEDWSPQRTQYIDLLGPGQSANLPWIINTILDGNYMVYMVLLPAPDGQEATSQPVASSGIHLTVTPFTRLNPYGILPYALGVPIVLLLLIVGIYYVRRRRVDEGSA
jgi:ABC-type transport system involved in cytochrome c biogenesis permease component